MKKFCALYLLVFFASFVSISSFAQKRTIKARLHKEEVEGVSREGAAVDIELNNKSIVKEWESTLKTYGKLSKLKGDAYKVSEATFPGVTGTCVIYARCYSTSKGYIAWWSIDNGSHITSNSKNSEAKLEEFARQQYINDINDQIKDAEDAVKSATKAQDKQVQKGKDLVKSIEKNKQETAELQKELEQLNKDVETNKGDQKAAADEVAKMQKALEVVKAKLNTL